jgi:hypothetical protein
MVSQLNRAQEALYGRAVVVDDKDYAAIAGAAQEFHGNDRAVEFPRSGEREGAGFQYSELHPRHAMVIGGGGDPAMV